MNISFFDRSLGDITIAINDNDVKFITYGGQARIYSWKYLGKMYSLKVLLNDEIVFRRLSALKESVDDKKPKIPGSVKERGFPVGQGSANPKEFEELGWEKNDKVSILVFNWIEGKDLREYLENEPPLSERRKSVTLQVLEILTFFERAGIVHSDLYPDNFIVKASGEVCIIDMEGAGLFDPERGTWVLLPGVSGKEAIDGYCDPPEGFPESFEDPKFFGDRWVGAILVLESLLAKSPFRFFGGRLDMPALSDLYEKADKKNIAWPPYGSERIESKYLSPTLEASAFRNEIRKMCPPRSGKCSALERLAFLTFVYGFETPALRPSFTIVKELLLNEELQL